MRVQVRGFKIAGSVQYAFGAQNHAVIRAPNCTTTMLLVVLQNIVICVLRLYHLPPTACRLPAAPRTCRLPPTTYNLYRATYSYHLPPATSPLPLPPPTYPLPRTTYHVPRTTYHVPRTTYHVPPTTYHLPPTTYHLPPTLVSYTVFSRARAGRVPRTHSFT